MAVQRFRARKATIRAEVRGRLSVPEVDGAIRAAQEENARLAQSSVRTRAQGMVRHRDGNPRHGDPMIQGYVGRTIEGGRTVSLVNRRRRALWFEEGTRPHPIVARRGGRLKFPNVPPQGGWSGPFVYPWAVQHPGQGATHVMRDTVRDLTPAFQRNIAEHVGRALARGD